MNEKKNKWIAFLLALAFGYLGLHRFYLRQNGLGILYIALALTGISFLLGLFDAVAFLTMSYDRFNKKYNKQWYEKGYRHPRRFPLRSQRKKQRRPKRRGKKLSDLKKRGLLHFKAYELEEAAEHFRLALDQAPQDVPLHFNLACTYARLEEAQSAWTHLQTAVQLGFDDFEKIDHHPALAYLRIQPDWLNQREALQTDGPGAPSDVSGAPLLQRLQALSKARDQGILTAEEFREKRENLLQQKGKPTEKSKKSETD